MQWIKLTDNMTSQEIAKQLKKLDDWENHVANIDSEAICLQRLKDLKDSNGNIEQDDSTNNVDI